LPSLPSTFAEWENAYGEKSETLYEWLQGLKNGNNDNNSSTLPIIPRDYNDIPKSLADFLISNGVLPPKQSDINTFYRNLIIENLVEYAKSKSGDSNSGTNGTIAPFTPYRDAKGNITLPTLRVGSNATLTPVIDLQLNPNVMINPNQQLIKRGGAGVNGVIEVKGLDIKFGSGIYVTPTSTLEVYGNVGGSF
jgi:hypothetical protein